MRAKYTFGSDSTSKIFENFLQIKKIMVHNLFYAIDNYTFYSQSPVKIKKKMR